MKGYVVTLLNIPDSVQVAKRCIESAIAFGIEVQIFPATYRDVSLEEMKKEGLKLSQFDSSFSKIEAVIGNFISQYKIWKKIIEDDEAAIILEHDAVFVDSIPDLNNQGEIINLGKPSYGNFKQPLSPGIHPLFSKPGGYFPGAHGYYVTPVGAKELISVATRRGIAPCDVFLNKQNFSNLKEVYPWPIEARDEFSTIQKEKGCKAKHNFNDVYKLI